MVHYVQAHVWAWRKEYEFSKQLRSLRVCIGPKNESQQTITHQWVAISTCFKGDIGDISS